jgi:hypothetical protein
MPVGRLANRPVSNEGVKVMAWAIRKSYGFDAVEVLKETDQTVFFRDRRWRNRDTRGPKNHFLEWRGDEDAARSLVAKLTSAKAEYDRRKDAAAQWYYQREAEILNGSK